MSRVTGASDGLALQEGSGLAPEELGVAVSLALRSGWRKMRRTLGRGHSIAHIVVVGKPRWGLEERCGATAQSGNRWGCG